MFLKLPSEIREMIYRYALYHEPRTILLRRSSECRTTEMEWTDVVSQGSSSHTLARKGRTATSFNALILTCRAFYLEADSTFFYRNNHFEASSFLRLKAFIHDTRLLNLQAIRELTIGSTGGRINLGDIAMLKSLTNLHTLTFSLLRSKRSLVLWNVLEEHANRDFIRAVVKATLGWHSLQTLRVVTRYSGDVSRQHPLFRGLAMGPDEMPGWVYSGEGTCSNTITESLKRVYGPHPEEMAP